MSHPYLTSLNCSGCEGPAIFERVQRNGVLYVCHTCGTRCLVPKRQATVP